MALYQVTLFYSFTFDTDQYYDVDDEAPNFDPQDADSVAEFLEDNTSVDVLGDTESPEVSVKLVGQP